MAENKPLSSAAEETEKTRKNENTSSVGNGTANRNEAFQQHIDRTLAYLSTLEMAHNVVSQPSNSSDSNAANVFSGKKLILDGYLERAIKSLKEEPCDQKLVAELLIVIKSQLELLLLSGKKFPPLEDGLDVAMIKKQAKTGTLDLPHYIKVLQQIMLQMCSPQRDGEIKELKKVTDPATALRGICSLVSEMQKDLMQFLAKEMKNVPTATYCLEKEQLDKYVQTLGTDVALSNTRKWLETTCQKCNTKDHDQILNEAFVALLYGHHRKDWPETCQLYRLKIAKWAKYKDNLQLKASIYLIIRSTLSEHLPKEDIVSFEEEIAEDITCLMADNEPLCTVSGHIVDVIKKKHSLADDILSLMKAQIVALEKPDHSVAKVVDMRLKEYIKLCLQNPNSTNIPICLLLVKGELKELCKNFGDIVRGGKIVGAAYYKTILQNALDA